MRHPTTLPLTAHDLERLCPLSPPPVLQRIANFLTVFMIETGITAKRPLAVLAAILGHSTSDESDGFCWPGSKRLAGLVRCSYSVFRAARLDLYDTGRVRRETRVINDGTPRKGYVIDGWDDVHDDHFDDKPKEAEGGETVARRAQNSELKTQNSEPRREKALKPRREGESAKGTGSTTAVAHDPILDSDIEQAHGEVEEAFLAISQRYDCYRGWSLKYVLRLPPHVTKHTLLCWHARAEIEGRWGKRAFWMSCIEQGYSEFSDKHHVRERERRLVEDWEAGDDECGAMAIHQSIWESLETVQQTLIRRQLARLGHAWPDSDPSTWTLENWRLATVNAQTGRRP